MAYAYNQSRYNRPGKGFSSFKAANFRATNAKRLITIIIILVIITVIISVIYTVLQRPDRQILLKTNSVATNYYENYFYENMLQSDNYSGNPANALSRFQLTGIASTTLEQLLLLGQSTDSDAEYLRRYCDTENTIIRFYPDPPYSRTSYHTDITYSCNY